jgi:hypothetical protein
MSLKGRTGFSRHQFTEPEDALLILLTAHIGVGKWDEIAAKMVGRNARQCRERWKHYLSVRSSERPWTKEEDELLIEKRKEIGPKWTKLAALFDGRSDIQVKSRCSRIWGTQETDWKLRDDGKRDKENELREFCSQADFLDQPLAELDVFSEWEIWHGGPGAIDVWGL